MVVALSVGDWEAEDPASSPWPLKGQRSQEKDREHFFLVVAAILHLFSSYGAIMLPHLWLQMFFPSTASFSISVLNQFVFVSAAFSPHPRSRYQSSDAL